MRGGGKYLFIINNLQYNLYIFRIISKCCFIAINGRNVPSANQDAEKAEFHQLIARILQGLATCQVLLDAPDFVTRLIGLICVFGFHKRMKGSPHHIYRIFGFCHYTGKAVPVQKGFYALHKMYRFEPIPDIRI